MSLAALALVVAAGAAFGAWRAAVRADAAVARLAAAPRMMPPPPGPGVPPGGSPPAEPPRSAGEPEDGGDETEPSDATGAEVPTLSPTTRYSAKYTGEVLTLSVACNRDINVDLDEPRVQVGDNVSEIAFSQTCGGQNAQEIRLGAGVEGSEITSDNSTPVECAEKIRLSPLASDRAVPIRRGQVFCVKTSLDTARASAISWKMVVLSVTAIAQDNTVSLKASAWDIPD